MRLTSIAIAGLGLSGCCTTEHIHHYRTVRAEAPAVRSYTHRVHRAPVVPRVNARLVPYRPPEIAVQDGCAPSVRVVGADAWTERGAVLKARRMWVSQVRFDLGEKFSDLAAARDVNISCVPASANESTVGKIGKKVAGNLAVRDRCVVEARPCER